MSTKGTFVLLILGVLAGYSFAAPGGTIGGGSGGFQAGVGGFMAVGCSQLTQEITRNWFDVKGIMAGTLKAKRPRGDDLQCISPYYIENAFPRPTGARNLHCFELDDDMGTCCDQNLQTCAILN